MHLISEKRKEMIKKYGKSKKDTGATKVQIGILSFRIKYLSNHLGINKKDFHTKRSLIQIISKRRKLLNYLQKNTSIEEYKSFITELGIRK